MRIEIIGNIASGKTTLAHLLSSRMVGVYENFQSNPFWEDFYDDPQSNAFETELTFTLQHYHSIKLALLKNEPFVCDFSLWLDWAYAEVTLAGERRRLYSEVFENLLGELLYPDKIIHLSCPEEVLLDRIRARGRSNEDSITIEYLQSLSDSIDNVLQRATAHSGIIEIDSFQADYAHKASTKDSVREMIFGQ